MSLSAKIVGYYGLNGDGTDSHGGNDASENLITWNAPGFLGDQYASFNGLPSRLDGPGSPITGTGSWSVFCWVRAEETGGYNDLIAFGSQANNQAIFLAISPGGFLHSSVYAVPGSIDGATFIADGNWHLVGAVYDSGTGTLELFVDGAADGSMSMSPNLGPDYLWMGQLYGGSGGYVGDMDDVSIYNDTLDQDEIDELWNGGSGLEYPFSSNPDPLTADSGSFTLTGVNTTLTANLFPKLVAEAANFTLNSRAVNLTLGTTRLLIAQRATFRLDGYDAIILKPFPVSSGVFTLEFPEAEIERGGHADLVADTGFFDIPPSDAELLPGETNLLIAWATDFSLIANDAQIYKSLSVSTGIFFFAGDAGSSTFSRTYVLSANTLSLSLEGLEVEPKYDRILHVDHTSFTFDEDIEANLLRGYYLDSDQVSYSLNNRAATIFRGYVVRANPGPYTLTYNNAGTYFGRRIINTHGTFSITGIPTAVKYGRRVPITHASFSLTGYSATVAITKLLAAATGIINLSGKDVQLVYASPLGPGLILANLEAAFEKLMDQNHPQWPGFPAGNAIVASNFANAIHAYAKYVRPQSSGAALGLPAFISAMMPLLSAPGPTPFFPAIQAGMTAYATALATGMVASGHAAVPPVTPADWVDFLALPKSGPLNEKITDLATVIHEWFLEGTATPIAGGSTVNWS